MLSKILPFGFRHLSIELGSRIAGSSSPNQYLRIRYLGSNFLFLNTKPYLVCTLLLLSSLALIRMEAGG